MQKTNLRFNFGYLLEASYGTSSDIEIDYPHLQVDDIRFKNLRGSFRATRTGEGIYLGGLFATQMPIECHRCLIEAYLPIEMELAELFYYPPATAPEGEVTVGMDGNADLGPVVRELSLISMPMQAICRKDCKGLCPECGQNLNEAECSCDRTAIDPRLAALQKLLTDRE